jgi:transcriptional regulator GlxA family with amidase domain
MVMTATKMPLVEVAFSVGFGAQAHFSTVFKRFTGKTPVQWKQEFQRADLRGPDSTFKASCE